jgi:hypothetical protein
MYNRLHMKSLIDDIIRREMLFDEINESATAVVSLISYYLLGLKKRLSRPTLRDNMNVKNIKP